MPYDTAVSPSDARSVFEIFYDGDCPLCRREIAFLRDRDHAGRIRFSDITAPDFDPAALGTNREALMARIHGRMPDGRLVEGVEVFRQVYERVGFGRLVRMSRLPGVASAADAAYAIFARHRLRLTGRCAEDACTPRTATTR